MRQVAERITEKEGTAPGGWSSPWLTHTPGTPDLLAQAGYRYLLDLRPDDQPVWLKTSSSPLLAIPYALELNDSTTMVGRQISAADFAAMVIDEFDELRETSADQPLVKSVVLHSFIAGARSGSGRCAARSSTSPVSPTTSGSPPQDRSTRRSGSYPRHRHEGVGRQ